MSDRRYRYARSHSYYRQRSGLVAVADVVLALFAPIAALVLLLFRR